METGKTLAIKRINKDIQEIVKNPLEGIGITSIDNDPFKYVVNIRLMSGIYIGYSLQLLLVFSDNYPIKPPKVLVFPNQALNGEYHRRIFRDNSKDQNGKFYKKISFPLIDRDFKSTKDGISGWKPTYSISSLLVQLQNFISDPDLPESELPNKEKIKQLMNSMNYYERSFTIKEKEKEIERIHTWNDPYPKMYFSKNEKRAEINKNNKNKNDNDNEINEQKVQIIKENLSCFVSKLNYIDDPDTSLGYTIIQKQELGKNKIELFPIPEIVTYEGFLAKEGEEESTITYYYHRKLNSENSKYYNYWIPIYINENHYSKNEEQILNSFMSIKYGESDDEKNDFEPESLFEILPKILNRIIKGMINDKSNTSSAFIKCYYHYVLLFKRLSEKFQEEYINYLNQKMNLIYNNEYNVAKSIIRDIDEFLILLFFCNKNTHTEKMSKIWYSLFEEYLVRQAFWIFEDEKNKRNIIKLMLKNTIKKEKEYLERKKVIEEKALEECIKDGYIIFKEGKKVKDFVDILEKEEMFKSVASLFYSNYDIKFGKENVVKQFRKNFRKLFNKANASTRSAVYKRLIESGKLNLYEEFFEISNEGEEECSNRLIEKEKELCEKLIEEKIDEILKKTKEELIDDENYLNSVFPTQRGNKLLLIAFFAHKKTQEKGFMDKLESNNGIFLEVNKFLEEMNQELSEIRTYSQFYEYLGSEYGKNKTDVELIKEAYEKAVLNNYIRNNDNYSEYSEYSYSSYQSSYSYGRRSRGRGGYSWRYGRRARGW